MAGDQTENLMKTLRGLAGGLIGAGVGLAAGLFFPFLACGLVDTLLGTSFGLIGWVVLFATIPGGFTLGLVYGGLTFARRPRLFAVTFAPLAFLLIGFIGICQFLREEIHTPRSYKLVVTGKPGKKYIGLVQADGVLHTLKGTLPTEFECQALHVEFAFAMVDPKVGEKISVEVLVEGKSPYGRNNGREVIAEDKLKDHLNRQKDDDIVAAEYKSSGYAEWIGSTSYYGGSELRAKVADLRK